VINPLELLHDHLPSLLRHVLHDVGVECAHDLRRCRHQRGLHEHHVDADVGVVVLVGEGVQKLTHKRPRVLDRRVQRLRLGRRRQDLFDVLHFKCLIHPAVGSVQIVQLRVGLRQLKLRLCQRDTLGHREDVRIRDRNYIYAAVEVFGLDRALGASHVVRVLRRQVVSKDARQESGTRSSAHSAAACGSPT
jgi:hypothetical protein